MHKKYSNTQYKNRYKLAHSVNGLAGLEAALIGAWMGALCSICVFWYTEYQKCIYSLGKGKLVQILINTS